MMFSADLSKPGACPDGYDWIPNSSLLGGGSCEYLREAIVPVHVPTTVIDPHGIGSPAWKKAMEAKYGPSTSPKWLLPVAFIGAGALLVLLLKR